MPFSKMSLDGPLIPYFNPPVLTQTHGVKDRVRLASMHILQNQTLARPGNEKQPSHIFNWSDDAMICEGAGCCSCSIDTCC